MRADRELQPISEAQLPARVHLIWMLQYGVVYTEQAGRERTRWKLAEANAWP